MTPALLQSNGERACRDPMAAAAKADTKAAGAKAEPLSPSLWDTVMVAFSEELEGGLPRKKGLVQNKDAVQQGYEKRLQDPAYRKLLSRTTKNNILERINLMRQMLQRCAPKR